MAQSTAPAQKSRGRIFQRTKGGTYYVQFYVDGRQVVKALRSADGAKVTDEAAARDASRLFIEDYGVNIRDRKARLVHEVERLQQFEGKVQQIDAAEEAEREARKAEAERPAWKASWTAFAESEHRRKPSAATMVQYRYQWGEFSTWMAELHPEIGKPAHVSPAIAAEYIRDLKKRRTICTVNKHRSLLGQVYRAFVSDGTAEQSPFANITHESEEQAERREIPLETLARVCDAAQGETKTLLFLGIYTAARLKDCALLRWDSVDLVQGTITLVPFKTRRRRSSSPVTIPIHPCLRPMLEATPPAERRGYVLPQTAETYQNRRNTITSRIQRLLEGAGLELYHDAEEGVAQARRRLRFGFHSLRHSAVTLLREAGAPEATVMALVGHNSRAMTGKYTHVGTASLAAAVSSMPALPGSKALPAAGEPSCAALRERIEQLLSQATEGQLHAVLAVLEGDEA